MPRTLGLVEKREKARLRSERWRRAHGIGPRKPAQKPWLAEGISRSTWYRRGNRISARLADLSRASAFVYQLQLDLAEAARCHAIAAGIIGEMSDFNHWSTLGTIGALGPISVLKK
jgi:hypothetical protein